MNPIASCAVNGFEKLPVESNKVLISLEGLLLLVEGLRKISQNRVLVDSRSIPGPLFGVLLELMQKRVSNWSLRVVLRRSFM